MYVENVYQIVGRGTVVTGKIEQGVITPGTKVEILGLGDLRETVVTSVEQFNKQLEKGEAGQSVGLLLRGVKSDEVGRGQVLAAPRTIKPQTQFQCEVYILSKEEGGRHTPIFNGYQPQFFFRTTDVTGVIKLPNDVEMAMPGDNTQLVVNLDKAIAFDVGSHFAVREGGKTVGSGVVTAIL